MEKYLGVSVETLGRLRDEMVVTLQKTCTDNVRFPTDGLLYDRIIRLSNVVIELTTELQSRFDETLQRF